MSDDAIRSKTAYPTHMWVGLLAGIVAPTTLLTGLCYYFGFVSARAYFAYFGVDTGAFGFTTADYVLRSVSVLHPALVSFLAVACVAFWVRTYGLRLVRRGRQRRVVRHAGWSAIGVGVLLVALSVSAVMVPRFSPVRSATLVPILLAVGAVLIIVGVGIRSALGTDGVSTVSAAERSTWLFAGIALVLALFWCTNIFATEYGRGQAQNVASELWDKETVVILDTADLLYAPANLVHETVLDPSSEERFGYRYQCLRTLLVGQHYWVLLPARWTTQYGYVLVLPVDEYSRISMTRLEGIDKTDAANWDAEWTCPEVAPF
ncbi:hypothetical protein [Rhodococcus rhodochrous]|uniref:hypothetical protein n=1 Tax=Rhodococcus rhodochrous TaxID=1829 RepID=UPI00188C6D0D|nr:hypothetical protein [Rhodococcus rhodochrous]MBF4481079.1 hypothetical protein [Rhodococcus rhodochrous]